MRKVGSTADFGTPLLGTPRLAADFVKAMRIVARFGKTSLLPENIEATMCNNGDPPPEPEAPPTEVAKPHETKTRPVVCPTANLSPDDRVRFETAVAAEDRFEALVPRMLFLPRPGSSCQIGGEGERISATVSAVSIHPGNRILIQVTWWAGRTHHEEWLESHEVDTAVAESRMLVGFQTQRGKEAASA